jgi:hypothetical protein
MTKVKSVLLAACVLLMAGVSEAKTVRATEMNGTLWSNLSKGALSDIIIEFRQGDELPVNLTAEGDLMETTQTATSYIGIKRNFWLKVQNTKIQISLDGTNFKEMNEVLSGSIEAGAGSDQNGGIANAINVAFKAFLK